MPILWRDWEFQENSLSRRVLHFLDHDILYECKHSLSSRSRLLPQGTRQLFNRIDSWRAKRGDAYSMWRRSIETYYFTMPMLYASDRLPAMSGLAQAMFRRFHPPQVLPFHRAGLWSITLAQYL